MTRPTSAMNPAQTATAIMASIFLIIWIHRELVFRVLALILSNNTVSTLHVNSNIGDVFTKKPTRTGAEKWVLLRRHQTSVGALVEFDDILEDVITLAFLPKPG